MSLITDVAPHFHEKSHHLKCLLSVRLDHYNNNINFSIFMAAVQSKYRQILVLSQYGIIGIIVQSPIESYSEI